MKTIEVKLLKFHELSEDARLRAIENYREENSRLSSEIQAQDLRQSQKAFLAAMNSEINYNVYRVDSNADGLTGVRLATFILNNYAEKLVRPKVYYKGGVGINTKFYHSKIQVTRDCALTGYALDDYFTQPIWDFIESPDNTQELSDVIENAVDSAWKKHEDDQYNFYTDDDCVASGLEARDFDFTENGDVFEYCYAAA